MVLFIFANRLFNKFFKVKTMAFSKGKVSNGEGVSYNKLIGFGNVKIVAVNPNKKEINKLTGRELEEEPAYIKDMETEDGKKYKSLRLDFYVAPDLEKPLDRIQVLTMFVESRPFINKAGDKAQVIDKYGRNKWLDRATIEAHEHVDRLDDGYKVARKGEVELISFLRAFLNVDSPEKYVTKEDGSKEWVMKTKEELAVCESGIENWDKIFSGDTSEISDIIGFQSDNKVKVLFYIKVTEQGAMYQGINPKEFLIAGAKESSFIRVGNRILDAKNNGYGVNDIYEFVPVHEFEMAPTNQTNKSEDSDLPLSDSSDKKIPEW